VKVRSALHALLRELAEDRGDRSVLAGTVAELVRSRRRWLALSPAPCFSVIPGDKGLLWAWLSGGLHGSLPSLSPDQRQRLLRALQATHAFRQAQDQAAYRLSSPFSRGLNYRSLLHALKAACPERLIVFHHYDSQGVMPTSWLVCLLELRRAGWAVVVSTSVLAASTVQQLEAAGVYLAYRRNVGLCLGAYKDLSLLLSSDPALFRGLKSLVLCNDSNLPVQAPSAFLSQLQAWVEAEEAAVQPVLAGLTDSAQRGCYHLQSFLLYANRALLQHPAWLRFWLGFSLAGSKDDLINNGEIGLSQALLAAGVQLRPAYPLVQGLLSDPAMAEELQRYSIWQPCHVNQSLFAWQSLLARGFPLVKKHVLFDLIENQGLPMAMAELARWIPAERRELLAADLQQLFVSRYSGGSPEPA